VIQDPDRKTQPVPIELVNIGSNFIEGDAAGLAGAIRKNDNVLWHAHYLFSLRLDQAGDQTMDDMEPLRTLADYDRALKEIETYFKDIPPAGTEAAVRFDALSALIEKFEAINFPMPK
jgi:hypothetical protein